MVESLIESEAWIRLGFFTGIFTAMAIWEIVAPRRPRPIGRRARWPGNILVVVVNTAVVRIVLPASAVSVAIAVEASGWGLLNLVTLPLWLAALISVLVLDLAIYTQHVVFHYVPVLWRLHRMHHADIDIDVTTGARFHPIEIVLSMCIKFALIVILGAPAAGVLVFEIILNATSMFNHSNVRIATRIDRWLRCIVVTPDMHRVHHSIVGLETNSNFGFNLPWWDRLFSTYRAQPAAGHQAMIIGIDQFRDPQELRIDRMLLQPLRPGSPSR
ncbi:MAG: sterol desaturase family protein [Gammaproteobacteria bacterium]|nr:sterol desaturase family protein [Gammaproteobacteria bacterium]MDH3468339.1 sterol desaturase family protein [Gammaproteobacteria bacterium]